MMIQVSELRYNELLAKEQVFTTLRLKLKDPNNFNMGLMGCIIDTVGGYYHTSAKGIVGHRRNPETVLVRHVVMYFARKRGMSLTEIGVMLGRRDHTTILHGVNRITRLIQHDEELAQRVVILTDLIEKKVVAEREAAQAGAEMGANNRVEPDGLLAGGKPGT